MSTRVCTSMALHHCEHGHAASPCKLLWTVFRRKNSSMVSCCCGDDVYV